MAPVRIKDGGKPDWKVVRDLTPPEMAQRLSERELDALIFFHEEGTSDSLQMFEIRYPPDTVVATHAHYEDQIVYVVEGSMKVGARSLPPGSSLFVQGGTLYGFSAGPEGLRMLNFRRRMDVSFLQGDEVPSPKRQSQA